eukprot:scaffold108_cov162-Amphora_coffeaeformis.AAC.6
MGHRGNGHGKHHTFRDMLGTHDEWHLHKWPGEPKDSSSRAGPTIHSCVLDHCTEKWRRDRRHKRGVKDSDRKELHSYCHRRDLNI